MTKKIKVKAIKILLLLLLSVNIGIAYAQKLNDVVFGYPINYDQTTNTTLINRGVTLSIVGGVQQNIKVGIRDYFIIGNYKDVKDFLSNFKEFKITSQILKEDGHFVDGGSVKMILQNSGKDAKELLAGYLQDKIVNLILAGTINLLPELESIIDILGADLHTDIVDILQSGKTTKERIDSTISLLSKGFETKKIDKKDKIILKFASYAAPENGARIVHDFKKDTVSLDEVMQAFVKYLK